MTGRELYEAWVNAFHRRAQFSGRHSSGVVEQKPHWSQLSKNEIAAWDAAAAYKRMDER